MHGYIKKYIFAIKAAVLFLTCLLIKTSQLKCQEQKYHLVGTRVRNIHVLLKACVQHDFSKKIYETPKE